MYNIFNNHEINNEVIFIRILYITYIYTYICVYLIKYIYLTWYPKKILGTVVFKDWMGLFGLLIFLNIVVRQNVFLIIFSKCLTLQTNSYTSLNKLCTLMYNLYFINIIYLIN